jgi:Zn-finger nucleic acid-binding protein
MQCPIDQTDLLMTDRNGVEIDYCPKCRGVWLDRGELDKIIERAGSSASATVGSANQPPSRPESRQATVTPGDRYRDDDDDDYTIDKHGRRKKKKGSFLEDLFDF